ncbi:hypothetical protein K2X40_03385 [Candidatus Babeliales bacterium]|nr:hypothetical protein [Candidatus Babeliales bacterium]
MKHKKFFSALALVTMLSLGFAVQAASYVPQVVEVDGVSRPHPDRALDTDGVLEQLALPASVAKPVAVLTALVVTTLSLNGVWWAGNDVMQKWNDWYDMSGICKDPKDITKTISCSKFRPMDWAGKKLTSAKELAVNYGPYTPGIMALPVFKYIEKAIYKRTVLGLYERAHALFAGVADTVASDNLAERRFDHEDTVTAQAQAKFRTAPQPIIEAQNTFTRQAKELEDALVIVKQALKKASNDEEVAACVDLKRSIELLYVVMNRRIDAVIGAINAEAERVERVRADAAARAEAARRAAGLRV